MKSRFLQYLQCENDDSEVPHVGNSNQIAIKNDLEINLKMTRAFMYFELQITGSWSILHYAFMYLESPKKPRSAYPDRVLEILDFMKIVRCSRGAKIAKIAPQGAPEIKPKKNNDI